jgi:hypothetical protein
MDCIVNAVWSPFFGIARVGHFAYESPMDRLRSAYKIVTNRRE